jgi:PAS domain-containing protein
MSRLIRDQSKNDSNAEEPVTNPYGEHRGKKGFLLNSLPWLSLPILFLLIILCLYSLNSSETYQSPRLAFLLGFVFMTFGGVLIAFLAARSFLSQSMPSLLMLGCGALILASGSVVSTAMDAKDINGQIAVYNICFCLSAFCHLAGALIKPKQTKAMSNAPGVWLGLGLLFSLFLVWIVRVLVVDGLVPPFFIQGQGGTPLRQGVLISAIGMFVFSAALLKQPKPKSNRFSNWYALALVLIAVGLLGVLLQHSQASLIGWTGRAAQYLGGACMLIAAVVSVRESRAWRLTIETALQESEQRWDITLASIGDAVLSADTDGRVTFLNKVAEELTGWTMAEASGKPVNLVFRIVNEHT